MSDLSKTAAAMDARDPLAAKRDLFHLPEGLIYLDGNSLGLMPKAAADRIASVTRGEWAEGLIRSWSKAGWFTLPMTAGDRIAPLIGAATGQVSVGDSTSVNIFKCLAAALQLRPERKVILAEGDNFPTDSYIAQGLAALVPDIELRYFEKGDNPAAHIDDDTAVLLLSHVDYRSARVRDMAAITADAHEKGTAVLWDLSHTTGAVACDLLGADADFAVGCGYKYLNGGPGAPAFAWVNPRHVSAMRQPLSGWMGHAAPFDFTRGYTPAEGARKLVCGTPQVISLSALDEALKLWADVDLAALWAKSRAMTGFFIEAVEELCAGQPITLASPREETQRGSHVSFDLEMGGFEVMQALAASGVIGDFRAPSTLRFGFAPLYLSFVEVLKAAEYLSAILSTREWDDDRFRIRGAVT
ncbi:kynureninase [Rhodobacteraceae bacterium F11138]|nr:kynureninase [Rhodobacteraceae bacterium F11138]